MIGQTVSHYRILEKLGEGGMGVVYKAEDTKLERSVALKFLSPHLLGHEDIRKRFEREAKSAAALHHSNICPVYEIDDAGGKAFIAMAHIEGESLDKKIAQGPLKIDEALDIAQQIACGLEAAHKKGIFHRDVKPENVIVDADGHVTVMDFGLARLREASRLTRTDEKLGTAAYMSPEQAQGAESDHRTDIWSLGVVLYEMATGRLPFKSDFEQAVLYSILNEEPEPLTALRTGVPMGLERVVSKCLAKRPDERYQTAADLIVDLKVSSKPSASLVTPKRAMSDPAMSDPPMSDPGKRRGRPSAPIAALAALAALATLAAGFLSWLHFTGPQPDRRVRKFAFSPPGFRTSEGRAAISPNGEFIAYTAGDPVMSLWIQPLDQENPRRLEGTEGATRPFWSPSSDFIGFVAGGVLKRASVSGGPPATVCRLSGVDRYFAGAWKPDGESIVFVSQSPARLFEVPARGGEPLLLVGPPSGGGFASSPVLLSDRLLLYGAGLPNRGIVLVARDMESGEEQEWPLPAGAFTNSPTGHILYQQTAGNTGDLWALPFSPTRPGPSGDPFPVARNAGWASIASNGTLVFRQDSAPSTIQLRIVDRSGLEISGTERRWNTGGQPVFSPNGKGLLLALGAEAEQRDIWRYDLTSRNWTPLTRTPSNEEIFPVWAPDGEQFAFSSGRTSQSVQGNEIGIYLQSAEPGDADVLIDSPGTEVLNDWNPATGRILYYRVETDERRRDLWYLEPDGRGGHEAKVFLSTLFDERTAAFSPDGRWVAYVTDQEGASEIYVRKFPEGSPVHKVSRQGGENPRWRRDGRELYYVEAQTLMAVEVTAGELLSFGPPTPLFSNPGLADDPLFHRYDAAPDGRSFAVMSFSEEVLASPPVIRVVENWYEEFRGREKTER